MPPRTPSNLLCRPCQSLSLCRSSQFPSSSDLADRAWFAISRFYDNCKAKEAGKKGYPRFQKDNRSVEYKITGWKFDPDGMHITFTDGCGIDRLCLICTRAIGNFPLSQIKRVRIIRRADGYYAQFAIQANRQIEHIPTGKQLRIDIGLAAYYTDSDGNPVENPHHYRKAEKHLKLHQRRLSRKKKGSTNRRKARKLVVKAYLKVQRQREDFTRKTANTLVSSCDLIIVRSIGASWIA